MSDDEWPGEWVNGREKMLEEAESMPDNEKEISFTNDHGTLYMVGDTDESDEWLFYQPGAHEAELRP